MATETKSSVAVKVRPGNQDGSSKGKMDSSGLKKKIDSSIKKPVDLKRRSVTTVTKTQVKSETGSSSSKATTKSTITTTTTKVRQKKVYTLAGQKYDTPEEREPLRIFYESLSKQIPTSEMAEFWMMEHGMLSPDKSKKAYEKKQKKQRLMKMGTPIKTPKPLPKSESSQTKYEASKNGDTKGKRRIIDSDDEEEFVLSPKRRKC